jgi:hypothetical protein
MNNFAYRFGGARRWRAQMAIAACLAAPPALAGDFDFNSAEIQEMAPAPGTVIGAEALEQYRQILDPDLADLIAKNWLNITVGEPLSFDPHPNFIAATQQYGGQAQLGSEPGQLLNYTAGRPFPGEPSLEDPRAGEKLIWNMRYGYAGDSGRIPEMYWGYRDMRSQQLERTLTFTAVGMRFMYRHVVDPVPAVERNPYSVYSAFTLTAEDPGDVSGTKILIFYNSDDNAEEQGWMYVPNLRRVRRIATTTRTDSFLGSDLMIEDFLGYSGRVKDMTWAYKGSTFVLLPMYRHDQQQHADLKARHYDYQFVEFGGHSACFPNVSWQLRKAYILEGEPTRSDHPLSKRYFYIDAQTMQPVMGKTYDKAGTLWKMLLGGVAHPDYHVAENKGSGVPLLDSSAAIDLQNQHCTTLQMLHVNNPGDVNQKDFEPSALNETGR